MPAKRKRLTDAEYAEMAADYAAKPPTVDEVVSVEVDPAFLRKGRPTEGMAPGKTPGFTVRLPDAIRVELALVARVEGSSPSELIRRAVVEYIGNHPVGEPVPNSSKSAPSRGSNRTVGTVPASAAPPATATTSGLQARVGVRQYFATEHLWNARHMAQLCADHEANLVAIGFRGIDRATRAFALAAILEAVAFLEALINGVWQDAAEDNPQSPNPNPRLAGLSVQSIARLRELWRNDRVERSLSVLEKYQVALTCVDQPKMDLGAEPGQSVDAIILLRNNLAHFKPKLQWTDELHKLEEQLRPRIDENPLFDGDPWFPHHVLTASSANLAYSKSRAFAEGWWQQMGFTWDAIGEVDSMAPQIPTS